MEEPTLHHQRFGWCLDVQQARTSGHPLRGSVRDESATTGGVLVLECAIDDVGDRLEAAVRMPRRALGLARSPLHRAHVIQQQERVGVAQRHAPRERPTHREAFALERRQRRDDLVHRSLHGLGVGCRDARKHEHVVDGDRRHDNLQVVDP